MRRCGTLSSHPEASLSKPRCTLAHEPHKLLCTTVDEEEIWGARAREILEAHDPATPLFYYYAFHLVHMDPINQMHVRKYLAQSMLQIASFQCSSASSKFMSERAAVRTAADWLQKFSFIEDSPIRQVYHAGV